MVTIENVKAILSRNGQALPLVTTDAQEDGAYSKPLYIPVNLNFLNLTKENLTGDTSTHVVSNEGLIILGGKLFLERNVNGGKVIQKEVKPTSLLLLSAHPHTDQYPLLSFEDIHPHHIFYLEESLPTDIEIQERFPFYALKMRSYTGIPGLAFFQFIEQDDPVFADCFVPRHIEEKVKWEVYDEMEELGLLNLG